MPHMLESMAYSNEVPWHGLGFSRPEGFSNVDQLLVDAKLDWTVEREPLMVRDHNIEVEGFAALMRSSDKKVLDIVGSRYVPIQNREVFEFFVEFITAGKATLETAGSIRGGKYVWCLAKLNQNFKLAGGDEVKGYLLAVVPHEQGKSIIFKFTSIRVVCNNTLTLALGRDVKSEHRVGHRKAFTEVSIEDAKSALGIAREQMSQFEKNARTLLKLKMTRDDVVRVLQPVYQPNVLIADLLSDFTDVAGPRMQRVMDIYEKAPGQIPGTGWSVLNASTYYSDHISGHTQDKRLFNTWLGKTADQKEQVLETLLNMAA